MITEQTELSPEQKMCAEYIDLGQQMTAIKNRRDALKAEMEELMRDGQRFDTPTHYLTWQVDTRTSFDEVTALACGDLSKDVYIKHCKVSVSTKLVSKKIGSESEMAAEQQLLELIAKTIKEYRNPL